MEKGGLVVGTRIVWMSDDGPECGMVKWIGMLPDARPGADVTVGVEFDNAVGSGTGKYKEVRLFQANQGHASLVPILGLLKEEEIFPERKKEMQNSDVRGRGRANQSHRGTRGGQNMNRGRGGHFGTEQGREGYMGRNSGTDENIDINCGDDRYVDRNRGRGGPSMNRGRGGHEMNRGRGGHDMNRERGMEMNMGRGGHDMNRGRGGYDMNRGRGGNDMNRGRDMEMNMGRGGHDMNRGRGGNDMNRGRGMEMNMGRGGYDMNRGRGGYDMNRGRGMEMNMGRGGYDMNRGRGMEMNMGRGGHDMNRGRGGYDMNRGRGGNDMNRGRGGRVGIGTVPPPRMPPPHMRPPLMSPPHMPPLYMPPPLIPPQSLLDPQPIHPRGQNRRRGRQPTRDNYQKQTMDTENMDHRENNQRGRSYGRRARGRGQQQNRHRQRGNLKVFDDSASETSSVVSHETLVDLEDIDDLSEELEETERKNRSHFHGFRGRRSSFRGRSFRSGRGYNRVRGRAGYAVPCKPPVEIADSDNDSYESESIIGSTDDSMSVTSDVSESMQSEKSDPEIAGTEGIDTLSIRTMRNRIFRYKRKLAELRKKEIPDMNEIKKLEDIVAVINDLVIVRMDEERKANERKQNRSKELKKVCKEKLRNVSSDESSVDSSDTDNKTSKQLTKPRKSKSTAIVSKKGNISFKPKLRTKQQSKMEKTLDKTNEKILQHESTDADDNAEINDKSDKLYERTNKNKKGNKSKGKIIHEEVNESSEDIKDLFSKLDDLCMSTPDPILEPLQKTYSKNKPVAQERKRASNRQKKESENSENDTIDTVENSTKPDVRDLVKSGPKDTHVFKFLVTKMHAVGTVDEIKNSSQMFCNADTFEWFRHNTRRFNLVERCGRIATVFALVKEGTYCLQYITARSCNERKCKHYHICKNLLCGNCVFGEKCKFSHNFLDDNNMTVSKRLGFDGVFTNEEILAIVRVRFPRVCDDWNDSNSCHDINCPRLHLCKRFVRGNCLKDDECPLEHSRNSDHNTPIVGAYNMGHWSDVMFNKMIYSQKTEEVRRYHKESTSGEETTGHDESEATETEQVDPKMADDRARGNSDTDRGAVPKTLHTRPSRQKVTEPSSNEFKPKDPAKESPEYYCDVCMVSCPGAQHYREHIEGQKHMKKEEAAKSGALQCELCDVTCPDTNVYADHIRGAKHQKALKHQTQPNPVDVTANTDNSASTASSSAKVNRPTKKTPTSSSSKKAPAAPAPPNIEESKIVADSASQTFLCEQFVIGQCRNQSCRLLHSNRPRLPYVWQVKLYNVWVNIDQSEAVEKLFCETREKNYHVAIIDEIGMSQTITICFEPDVSGVSSSGDKLSARRLSTKSYAVPKVKAGSFVTRWLWYWRDDMGSWQLFDTDAMQYTLESKFLYGQANFLYSRDNYRFKYALNFTGMQQLNLDTYKVRKITRRPTFVSGNDVKSQNMPSKDRLVSKPTAPVPLPSGWAPWDLAHPFELVELDPGHPDYIAVENSFFLTLLQHNEIIDNIYRVQCPALWNKFCSHRKSMVAAAERAGRGANIDERKLFHATDCLDTVRGICINNFDPRVSGKNGTVYGDGAYFAKNSKYSHAYSGKDPLERFVFQAIVLIGDFVVGNSSYRRPPARPGAAHELYDSCVNNIDNPDIFVIFDRDQYYPEYLIQYHDRPRSPDPVKRPAPARPQVPVASGYTSGTRSGSTTQSGSFQPTSSSSIPALSYPGATAVSYPGATAVSYPTHQVSYPATNPVSYPSGNTSSYPATSPVSYPTGGATAKGYTSPSEARDSDDVYNAFEIASALGVRNQQSDNNTPATTHRVRCEAPKKEEKGCCIQ